MLILTQYFPFSWKPHSPPNGNYAILTQVSLTLNFGELCVMLPTPVKNADMDKYKTAHFHNSIIKRASGLWKTMYSFSVRILVAKISY